METLVKFMFIAAVIGALHTVPQFRKMSRELDQSALNSLKKMMDSAEESGFPPEIVPLLIGLTALSFAVSGVLTTAFGR
jgi:hypothetical protein